MGTGGACPPQGVDRVLVELGDRSDSFISTGPILPITVDGGDGSDQIYGGRGEDTLIGGAGSDWISGYDRGDHIEVRDGVADQVECGTGVDYVQADTLDIVADDCEVVDRGLGPPPPRPPPPPPPPPLPPPPPPPAICRVPRVVGLRLRAARARIRAARCSVGSIRRTRSRRAGRVLRQSPGPGWEREIGAPVRLVVGR